MRYAGFDKICDRICLGLSPAISTQFTFEMRVAAQNRKKNSLKPPILGVQGHP